MFSPAPKKKQADRASLDNPKIKWQHQISLLNITKACSARGIPHSFSGDNDDDLQ
jgi:hypothetical protein